MTSTVRIGVVGAGSIAQVAHLPVATKLDESEVVAICDNDLPKAQALGLRFGVRDAYDDIEALLAYSKPDIVVICTPNHLHEVHILTALSHGASVLCERPLALSAAGVERIIEASGHAGRPVMVGMNHRYRSDVRAIRGFVGQPELGQLKAIRAGWYVFRPSRSALTWRRRRAESGGGAVLDLGLPLIDLSLWVAGHPQVTHVTSAFSGVDRGAGVEDSGCVLLACENDLSIFVDVSWHHMGDAERLWFEAMGSKGSASIGPLRVFTEAHGVPADVTPSLGAAGQHVFTASYLAEWAQFLAVTRGEQPAPDLDDQVVLHRLVAAAERAAREGGAVAP